MIRFKRFFGLFAAALVTASVALPASAQWATFDASNFMQNLQQVMQLKTQLDNMQKQLGQVTSTARSAESTYNSLHGSSGMGNLLNTASGQFGTSAYGDAQMQASIQSLANNIKQQAGFLSTQNLGSVNSAYRDAMIKRGDAAAAQQAMSQQVFDQSGAEFKNIQTLMDQINTAQDPKDIAGLQARIQAEQSILQNQVIRSQAMAAMMASQDRVDLQKQAQESAAQRIDYYKGNP